MTEILNLLLKGAALNVTVQAAPPVVVPNPLGVVVQNPPSEIPNPLNVNVVNQIQNIQRAGTANITVSPVITTASVKIIDANVNRLGLILYNNSANSIYLALGAAANSSTKMTFILATFAHLILPSPIFTGAIYGIRNAGTGTVLCTELIA